MIRPRPHLNLSSSLSFGPSFAMSPLPVELLNVYLVGVNVAGWLVLPLLFVFLLLKVEGAVPLPVRRAPRYWSNCWC